LGGIVPCTRAEGMRMLHEGLGPDALRDPLPVLHGKRAVKLVLMDQSVVAGVGNLHAAEALWRAGLSPLLPASSLAARQHRELDLALKAQLSGEIAAFEQEDEITYVEDAGANNPFPVYGQEGKRCPRCTATIERFTQGGRSTYWCPRCQK
jgi:formamidopyrimidine-DNA glycosylase